jgi:phospholipid/cholesterol/gamma-HCH transport system substrate-binding protein
LAVGFVLFGGSSYTVSARFQNANQIVKGGLVEISGKQVGTVRKIRLVEDNAAELTLEVDEKWAPLPRGTRAQVRQFGLSGPASRYVELILPQDRSQGLMPDGATIDLDHTRGNVDLDEVFSIFDPSTRKSLKGVFRGSARQYEGQAQAAKEGWLYLDPALVSATRLFDELNRDTPKLARFLDETSGLVGDIAQRREDLAGLVDHLATTTGALTRPPDALARTVEQLPDFMRQANTTYVNLRATLDDLDPLVRDFKPVAKKMQPYTRELRLLLDDLDPTIRGLARVTKAAGGSNDLIDLALATIRLRPIAVGPVERNGKEREGAFPATAEALISATPRLAFVRPYSVDFTGWLDDFSHSGNFDALGGFSRIGTHANAFTLKSGPVAAPLAPIARADDIKELALVGQNNRCPGSAERDTGEGTLPFKPTPDFNCDPTQLPPGN